MVILKMTVTYVVLAEQEKTSICYGGLFFILKIFSFDY